MGSHHFYLHSLGQNLVIGLHLTAKEAEKYNHSLGSTCPANPPEFSPYEEKDDGGQWMLVGPAPLTLSTEHNVPCLVQDGQVPEGKDRAWRSLFHPQPRAASLAHSK